MKLKIRKNSQIKLFALIAGLFIVFLALITTGCSLINVPKVMLKVNADNSYNANSSPAVVVIKDDSQNIKSSIPLNYDATEASIPLETGSYTANVVCPLNNDGSYYKCSYSNQFEIQNNSNDVDATFDLSKVDFDNANIDEINAIGQSLQQAISFSDGQINNNAMDTFNKNVESYKKKVEDAKAAAQNQKIEQMKVQFQQKFITADYSLVSDSSVIMHLDIENMKYTIKKSGSLLEEGKILTGAGTEGVQASIGSQYWTKYLCIGCKSGNNIAEKTTDGFKLSLGTEINGDKITTYNASCEYKIIYQ